MIEWFTAPGSGPFTAALLLMFGLALVEVGALIMGLSAHEAIDDLLTSGAGLEPAGDGVSATEATSLVGRALAWFYFGRVPALVILIVFLTTFGLAGLALQGFLRDAFGAGLPAAAAVPIVAIASLPVVRWVSGGLARVLPRDETSAVDPWAFIGATAEVVGPGRATLGLPTQARLVDPFGTEHYLLVEPLEAGVTFAPGDVVRLAYETLGGRYAAAPADPPSADAAADAAAEAAVDAPAEATADADAQVDADVPLPGPAAAR
jgi:hypothetical protein